MKHTIPSFGSKKARRWHMIIIGQQGFEATTLQPTDGMSVGVTHDAGTAQFPGSHQSLTVVAYDLLIIWFFST